MELLPRSAALRNPEQNPSLFTRLCNRNELQVVLMTSSELAGVSQSQVQAWGTGGLEPHELRALLHVLQRSPPSGRPAQHFIARLKERVVSLPPPEDASTRPIPSSTEKAIRL